MTAQMELSDEVFYERFDKLMEATKNNDDAMYAEIAATIPLPPELAMQRRSYMSKEEILEFGFDMSLVEAEYGKDWYEAPRTGKKSSAPGV